VASDPYNSPMEALRVEPSPKHVRVMLDGRFVADSFNPLLVWEKPYYPTYFFPRSDVDETIIDTVRTYMRADGGLDDYVALRWHEFDHWFEEDQEVFVHARDPYKRIDILASSRRVVVSIDDVMVADTKRPTLLFETSLRRRVYMPLTDLRMDLLVPSVNRTQCPYKGEATYWSVQAGSTLHTDVVWSYPRPIWEAAPIAGLACFYDERVDMTVDGVPQTRPITPYT
jgi:uncharacterized protein (DUF427 family)